jgi:hypothetical protein
MTKVHLTTELAVPAEMVWNTIGGFNALPDWHPAIAKSVVEKEGANRLRRLSLVGGGEIVERLERSDDKERVYSYSILSGPLPVANYTASIRVRQAKGGQGCTVEWSSEFDPAGAPESEAAKVIRGIYEAGFENLKKMFGAQA